MKTEYEVLQERIANLDSSKELYKRICHNIKEIRIKKYNEFKEKYPLEGINPYSTENIADLLNYNHNHYKRFESDNDSTKRIPLEKLVIISLILDVTIDELIN